MLDLMKAFTNIPLLVTVAILVVGCSIYADHSSTQWLWFQRSGSVVTLIGALLSYRSIMRLGSGGVGGTNTFAVRGKVTSVDDSGPVQTVSVSLSPETYEYLRQADIDRIAGYLGAMFILLGTAAWGYGDLLGRVL